MTLFVQDADLELYHGDCVDVLREFADDSCDACITSPPYLDARPEYESPSLQEFCELFVELRRVVNGPLIVNVGRLWRKKRELRWWEPLLDCADMHGWELLDTLIWAKPNANPIQGRIFTNAHEYCFIMGHADLELDVTEIRTPYKEESLARFNRRYEAHTGIKGDAPGERERVGKANEEGAMPKSYVQIYTGREKGNPHPAPMALELAEHLVKLACPAGGTIIDPFGGSGTTAVAARLHGRRAILIEEKQEYCELAAGRLSQQSLLA